VRVTDRGSDWRQTRNLVYMLLSFSWLFYFHWHSLVRSLTWLLAFAGATRDQPPLYCKHDRRGLQLKLWECVQVKTHGCMYSSAEAWLQGFPRGSVHAQKNRKMVHTVKSLDRDIGGGSAHYNTHSACQSYEVSSRHSETPLAVPCACRPMEASASVCTCVSPLTQLRN
jgi:hypothetical protein